LLSIEQSKLITIYKKEKKYMRGRYKIENGQKFGKLTVIKEVPGIHMVAGKYYFRRVLCQCECGNFKEIDYCNLVNGSTETCGCEYIERLSKAKQKRNQYDLSGEYGIGWTLKGEEFYFDIEDYDKIKDYCWYKNSNGYIVSNANVDNTKKGICFLHKVVMEHPKHSKTVIDHIDRNPTNNRKSNLRITTQGKNCINKGTQSNNTSGYTGVSWNEHLHKWTAYIGYNNKTHILGYYELKQDAIQAREKAEKIYFGEYAPIKK
jgi:hypothetical protein